MHYIPASMHLHRAVVGMCAANVIARGTTIVRPRHPSTTERSTVIAEAVVLAAETFDGVLWQTNTFPELIVCRYSCGAFDVCTILTMLRGKRPVINPGLGLDGKQQNSRFRGIRRRRHFSV